MNTLYRWTTAAAVAAALLVPALSALALTDTNAELKEAQADRAARPVESTRAPSPVRTVWVPPSAKRLDSFQPVLPPATDPQTLVAQTDARPPATKRR